tara:strand:+ start:285 stop:521 length:237 start_codon:yes stop_codon:yes gene_type:complete
MEALQILGWIYLGIMLGSIGGVLALGLFVGPKVRDYEQEIDELRLQRQLLKGEIERISRRGKPQPRKRKYWKRKPVKK